jgi:stage III sporulation protein SpoIIIAA
MSHVQIIDDLDALLNVLPPHIKKSVIQLNNSDKLLEIILDLGRVPTARFIDEEVVLSQQEITHQDISYVVDHIGQFNDDNRAGLERTLHRIAYTNRVKILLGLPCRVGPPLFMAHSI